MANSLQAKKRARQNNKRRIHNMSMKSQVRTIRKKLQQAITEKDMTKASDMLKENLKSLDKYAGKNIISKNTAARYKSRAVAAFKQISAITAK
ncbi:MAG: 30S ribosomal protein S20 [Legionellales bacterium]|nr:30S ribosomal protein S20 [Legionellales bacterium]